MRFCKIVNNKVVNVIEAEQAFIDTLQDTYVQDDNAGIEWDYDGVNLTAPQVPIPSFAEAKAQKQKLLNEYVDNQVYAMQSKYSELEKASFLDKRNEALAYRNDSANAKTPYVEAMSQGNATKKTAYLDAILVKVDALAALEDYAVVTRDAIEACTTEVELDAIIIGQ